MKVAKQQQGLGSVAVFVTIFFLLISWLGNLVHGMALRSMHSTEDHPEYYTYQTFKKLGLPAVAYSTLARAGSRLKNGPHSEALRPSRINSTSDRRKVAIVTGSNTGVGYATAQSLVNDHCYEVILACRSTDKGKEACRRIQNEQKDDSTKSGQAVWIAPLDLANISSVRGFAEAVTDRYETIDVLINNAGCNDASDTVTTCFASSSNLRLDPVFTTNFLGHFVLTHALLDRIHRVVHLSSVMHHFPYYTHPPRNETIATIAFWKNIAFLPLNYSNTSARKSYAPTKLAALLFSVELNRRFRGRRKEFQSIAVNPGAVYVILLYIY
jgi:NAD(P)-dependent dehydrogenase (short-subunit alcohol dehydrogenase family)